MNESSVLGQLNSLSKGFREQLMDYEALSAQLHSWAGAFADVVRLQSVAQTEEGREVWLLTVGKEPDRPRPAVWVDGNMHAVELSGTNVALAIAEDVIRLHMAPESALHGLPRAARERLRDTLFYIMPRISPDGAEAVLKTGRAVRSLPRDRRPHQAWPRWVRQDMDGDGRVLRMRVRDPNGDFVESQTRPGVMLPRTLEDEGPFYRVYPEGVIEHFDGEHIPKPSFYSDNETDLNRNFPWGWMPEPEQAGAGAHPMSEPESRAIVEVSVAKPHVFVWLNLHTFGGVHIRPLGHRPDNKMDPFDLAVYRQLAHWGTEHTGYPTVSAFEEFTYEPEKPLHGDMIDFAYHHRGCLAWTTELWDLFEQLGFEKPARFVERYMKLSREDVEKIAVWDAEHNRGRMFVEWKSVKHPQLGEVEIGGVDPRIGLWNPPLEQLEAICEGMSAMFLRAAAIVPRIGLYVHVESVAEGMHQVVARVHNEGYLPTHGMSSAKELPWNEPLYADAETTGCELLSHAHTRQHIGHLEGWGRGLQVGQELPDGMPSPGNSHMRAVRWTVRGKGTVQVRAGSCRTGFVQQSVDVPQRKP